MASSTPQPIQKSEEEWRAILSPEQFRILREKGTDNGSVLEESLINSDAEALAIVRDKPVGKEHGEIHGRRNRWPKGTGKYDKFFAEGVYNCAGCGTPLYRSTAKFNSGCGWPAFFEGLPGAITCSPDPDGRRTEITCTACGGHLGHVFKGEGFQTPTDERHCVNSVSVKFVPA